ncbi:precorrin-6Y C5,15-methyltransferase [Thermosipho melanesiensis]|uniref:Precorrin-6y C5,15-methyltransferase (Decarboxylating), CbiE subunit n=2 Tax=Thermosipho melanesiensis TaxID=46541 RepID=A6LKW2_THEM4|nr:precorrin-6y C5,15-methyltransferase (decarboxylating), CbiE subunit [Thermosipho melanesiensis BI429]APT73711.1 precorrin-6Y C5,15-methyltransferase [Thermosipho melanesiensis]OOC35650.1 precorrin-6Y C5,15-methyltransferase [Thermosipho melanesiensis]OOC38949.1 precorrin-6Y C5,15-methyltransferase [Thermosipho melanesiensis]OOC39097.1 precorrin-6Y C5,15-methyltransferase [Thermosipho melanesiensis]
MITIVGIGPGNPKYITLEGLEKIKQAKVLVGGKRHLDLFDCEKKIIIDKNFDISTLYSYENVVILASGEPSLYGIANTILKHIKNVEIIPGISCVQYMASKIKISLNNLRVISLHGKEEDFISTLKKENVFLFTDKIRTPQYIAKKLVENEMLNYSIFVGENLSYENEKIYKFPTKKLLNFEKNFEINSVIILKE